MVVGFISSLQLEAHILSGFSLQFARNDIFFDFEVNFRIEMVCVVEEDGYNNQWTEKISPDDETRVIASRMSFEPKTLDIREKYRQSDDNLRRQMSDYEEYPNLGDTYSFPYTGTDGFSSFDHLPAVFETSVNAGAMCFVAAEEDHCGSPYMSALRSAELPPRKLSLTHSPNLDLCRMAGPRSSIRSMERAYDGPDIAETAASLRSLDMGRGIHSSHSSIERKRAADEMSVHSMSRAYEPTYYGDAVVRGADESSIRSYSLKRGSNLSLRSDDHARYGHVGRASGAEYADHESRHGSDASLIGSTLPMQRRPFNASNEYGIANISESE